MQNQERREFIKTGTLFGVSALAVSAMSVIPSKAQLAAEKQAPGNDNAKSTTRILGSGSHSIKITHGMGLGCMGMSWNRSFVPNRREMINLIRKAYEMGVNFFDTAEAYGPFLNEELVGEAISPFRKDIILCSKFGFDIQNNRMTGGLNSKPQHIRQVVDQSLRRLKTDHIDILYQHRVDPNVPMEDVAGTIKDLIAAGKVRHFGLSEAGPASIRKAHAVQPVTALQTEFSLMSMDPIYDVMPVCEELGIGFVPYSPLCRAYLTGYINERTTYVIGNDNRPSLPRYQPAAIIANWKIIDVITRFGNERGITAAQVSLAWLMAQKKWVVPIPGTTKLAHLQENLWATDFAFKSDEVKNLREEIAKIDITGDRYATPQTN